MRRVTVAIAMLGLAIGALASAAPASLCATYFTVYPVGVDPGGPADADADFAVTDQCCQSVPNAMVLSKLGPHGLPVFNPDIVRTMRPSPPLRAAQGNAYVARVRPASAFPPVHDLITSTSEITWWSPEHNPHVRLTGRHLVEVPIVDTAMYPPMGHNPSGSDASARLTATFQGTIELPANRSVQLELGSDDDAFLYVDGQLVISHGGVHISTPAVASTPELSAGAHRMLLFYADRQPTGASLSFRVLTPDVGLRGEPCAERALEPSISISQ